MQFTLGKRIPKMGDEGLRNTCVRESLQKNSWNLWKSVESPLIFIYTKKIKNKRQIKHLDFIEYLNRNYIWWQIHCFGS